VLDLDPAKLLVVLLVALVVLGPDKLPRAARQAGAAWSQLRQWRARLEEEVRGSFPDLPSTDTITQAVRSPLGFLDRLADGHVAGEGVASGAPGSAAGAAGALGTVATAAPSGSPGVDAESTEHLVAGADGAGVAAGNTRAVPGAGGGAVTGAGGIGVGGAGGTEVPSQAAGPGSEAERATTGHDRGGPLGAPHPRVPYDALRVGDPSMN